MCLWASTSSLARRRKIICHGAGLSLSLSLLVSLNSNWNLHVSVPVSLFDWRRRKSSGLFAWFALSTCLDPVRMKGLSHVISSELKDRHSYFFDDKRLFNCIREWEKMTFGLNMCECFQMTCLSLFLPSPLSLLVTNRNKSIIGLLRSFVRSFLFT
jgi:hypothetical protein